MCSVVVRRRDELRGGCSVCDDLEKENTDTITDKKKCYLATKYVDQENNLRLEESKTMTVMIAMSIPSNTTQSLVLFL